MRLHTMAATPSILPPFEVGMAVSPILYNI
jgi:hypothetical protein